MYSNKPCCLVSLKRQLRDKADLDLIEVLKNADYDKITDDMFREAVEDAYKFTYQSSDIGFFGRKAVELQQKFPFPCIVFHAFPSLCRKPDKVSV